MSEIQLDKFPYIEKIVKLFQYDTIVLLDCVLTDDPKEPEYSANTVYNRIKYLVDFENEFHLQSPRDVWQWMNINGYSSADIDLLKRKMQEEHRYDFKPTAST